MKRILVAALTVALSAIGPALHAQTGNIDPTQRHAWAENAGWLDFRPVFGGVTVLPTHLTGYAWQEGVGWVKLGADSGGPYANTTATNWGVNLNSVTGALSGFAWSENAGWIRMDPAFGGVTYDGLTRQMSGWAWSESYGWLHFRSTSPTPYGVAVCTPPATPTPTNNGPKCEGDTVQLTVAYVAGGTWAWTGPNGFTSNEMLPTVANVTPNMAGDYSVVVTVDGCSSVAGTTTVIVNPRPVKPVITAPSRVPPGQSFQASVPNVAGVTYAWTITNGAVTAGSGTRQVTIFAGETGPVTVAVEETNAVTGCVSEESTVTIPVGLAATRFYPVSPCRLFDTRKANGPDAAAPALAAGETRTFTVGTRCGLSAPSDRSISINITVTEQMAAGELVLYRGDLSVEPGTSSISFGSMKTRANNGLLELSRDGDGTFKVRNRSAGAVHFILDVNGVFR